MTALNFPTSPTNGDTYENYVYDSGDGVWKRTPEGGALGSLPDVTITTPLNEQALIYNTATGNWINAAVAGGVEVSATAPAAPSAGDLWWNSTIGDLFVYYNDGTSSQWVPASGPKVTVQSTAPTVYEGQLWLDSTDGSMYVYYPDPGGANAQWIGAVSRSGGILQVVSTTKTDTFSSALTLGYVAVTGLTASITPSSTSSKVLVSGYCSVATSLTENSSDIAIYKDGVALAGASGDANGSAKRATSGGVAYTTSQRGIASVPFSFLDSPATTSTVSYEIYIGYTNNSATTMYVNRAASDTTNNYNSRWASTITLMEIAG